MLLKIVEGFILLKNKKDLNNINFDLQQAIKLFKRLKI
jgi:hypothetical protein